MLQEPVAAVGGAAAAAGSAPAGCLDPAAAAGHDMEEDERRDIKLESAEVKADPGAEGAAASQMQADAVTSSSSRKVRAHSNAHKIHCVCAHLI